MMGLCLQSIVTQLIKTQTHFFPKRLHKNTAQYYLFIPGSLYINLCVLKHILYYYELYSATIF